jgi:hypothetical protein
MSKLGFTARDFIAIEGSPSVGDYGPSAEEMAKAANARLAEMLAEAPMVYGWVESHENATSGKFILGGGFLEKQTHRARLVEIEPLDKP